MITDFNEMLAEVRKQYATLPYKSNGSFQSYEMSIASPLITTEKTAS